MLSHTRLSWMPGILFLVLILANFAPAYGQIGSSQGSKRSSLAVAPIETAAGVSSASAANGNAVALKRVEEAFESRLNAALAETQKFTVVARRNLDAILKEQSLAGSGFVNPNDPQTARALKVAGVKWLAVPRVIDFQDIVRTRNFEGLDRTAKRRSVRFTIVVDVLDTTTGVVGETAQISISDADVQDENNKALPEGGDPTDRVLDAVAQKAAAGVSCRILNVAYPAKVLASSSGTVSFNRGDGGCVESGTTWRVFRPGAAMIDPDTGDNLGQHEDEVGAIVVNDVLPKYSRARLIGGEAVAGDVLRPAPEGYMPPPGGFAKLPSQAKPAVNPTSGSADSAGSAGKSAAEMPSLAVLVEIVPGLPKANAVPKATSEMLQTGIVARVAGFGMRTIAPQDVLRALKPGDAEEIIASNAAATRLASAVEADSVLVVSLTSLDRTRSQLNRNGNTSTADQYTLQGNWRLVMADSGRSITGAAFTEQEAVMLSSGSGSSVQVDTNVLSRLVVSAAKTVAAGLEKAARSGLVVPKSEVTKGWVSVEAILDGVTVPEIVKKGDDWTVVSSTLPVLAGGADVAMDGLTVCTSPCSLAVTKGPHRLSVSRKGTETWSKEIQVLGNSEASPQRLQVSLRLTDSERNRWLENARVFEQLKIGAKLTDAEVKRIEGVAKFFSQSGFRIDRRSTSDTKVDTDEAPQVQQWNSFWNRPW